MDGNGRWAEARGLTRNAGHRAGAEIIKTIIQTCVSKQIKMLSIWAFGRDNWSRPLLEVDFLMQLFLDTLRHEIDELHAKGVRVKFIGSRVELAPMLREEMQLSETRTQHNTKFYLNIVMNYSGKWDIIQAAQAFAKRVAAGECRYDELNESQFTALTSTHDLPEPDLFIRTSGEQRLSNFFLWQLAYTELYFTNVAWPDFTVVEFEKALDSFARRQRRYGKIAQQCMEDIHV